MWCSMCFLTHFHLSFLCWSYHFLFHCPHLFVLLFRTVFRWGTPLPLCFIPSQCIFARTSLPSSLLSSSGQWRTGFRALITPQRSLLFLSPPPLTTAAPSFSLLCSSSLSPSSACSFCTLTYIHLLTCLQTLLHLCFSSPCHSFHCLLTHSVHHFTRCLQPRYVKISRFVRNKCKNVGENLLLLSGVVCWPDPCLAFCVCLFPNDTGVILAGKCSLLLPLHREVRVQRQLNDT